MILVFAESQNGGFKKAAFESLTYGVKMAAAQGVDCVALALGTAEGAADLGKYGVSKVYSVANEALNQFDSQVFAKVIAAAAEKLGANTVVLSNSSIGKGLTGRLAIRMNAASVSGASSVASGNQVQKSVYSGKATATYALQSEKQVISVMGNSIKPEATADAVSVESLNVDVPAAKTKVLNVSRQTGVTPLPEAEFVVSAGRGMKGPENWGIIEDLAGTLGATTACSRPVADSDWRPHHEHVGQTGIAIRPNLYFAIGISGAIQHLAGVNNSKVIVVINKDPEAPFFKAADYGIVGDLFDVVPKLNAALQNS